MQKRLMLEHPELLEEGWKEIALSIAMLANLAMPAQAQKIGEEGLTKKETIDQIQSVVNNPAAMTKVVDILTQQGYKNAEQKIETNAQNITAKLQKLSTSKSDIKTKHVAQKDLVYMLRSGYAITKVQSDTVYQKVTTMSNPVSTADTFAVTMDASQLYGAGGFTLTQQGVDSIKSIITQIQSQGGAVLGIRIESSTDKQRVSPNLQNLLSTKGYSADNAGLSKARNDGARAAMVQGGIDAAMVKQTVLAEQGAGTIGAETPQDPSARYVKIYIDAVKVIPVEYVGTTVTSTEQQIVNSFDMVYVSTASKSGFDSNLKVTTKIGQVVHGKAKPGACPVWGK